MCTLILAWRVFEEAPICVAANRDEAVDRPSSPPSVREGDPRVVAPRDEEAGGTWIGYNEHDVLVAVTNRWVEGDGDRSRGLLVDDALASPSARDAIAGVEAELDARRYAPFHLLAVDGDDCILVEHGGTLVGGDGPGVTTDGSDRSGEATLEGVRPGGETLGGGEADGETLGGGEADGETLEGDGTGGATRTPSARRGDPEGVGQPSAEYAIHAFEPGVHVVVNVGFDGAWFVPSARPEVGRRQAANATRILDRLTPQAGETAGAWTRRAGELLGDHECGVCIHGDGFGTRSSSLIRLGDERVYEFADGPPCETPYRLVEAMI